MQTLRGRLGISEAEWGLDEEELELLNQAELAKTKGQLIEADRRIARLEKERSLLARFAMFI